MPSLNALYDPLYERQRFTPLLLLNLNLVVAAGLCDALENCSPTIILLRVSRSRNKF